MRSLAFTLLFLAATAILAQEKLAETIEVRVVNVDVIVTDRAGNPVTGLTKDDFEVFENGKPQTITNFYAVQAEASAPATITANAAAAPGAQSAAAPEDIRARRFLICVDNYSLEPAQRNSVLASLRRFVEANMKAGDEMTLMAWARKLELVTPLTDSKAEIFKGIDALQARGRAGLSAGEEEEHARQDCLASMHEVDQPDNFKPDTPSDQQPQPGKTPIVRVSWSWDDAWLHCDGAIQQFADTEWNNGRALVDDLRKMVARLSGLDGRKILVLAGAHLPEHPGRASSLWMAQQFLPYQKFLKRQTQMNKGFIQSGGRSQTLAIDDTAHFANANGVAFYMIDGADLRDSTSAEKIDWSHEVAFNSFTDTASVFHALASYTGGAAISGTQNFDSAFQTLARDLSSFYSLGYKPAAGAADERKIAVKAKRPGITVRARQSYTPKAPDQEMNDRVMANVLHHGAAGEWPVRLTPQAPEKNGDLYKLPVTVEMDPKLTLLPDQDKVVGGFVLYIVVGTRDGAMSKVTRSARKIEMPAAAESQFRSKPMSYTLVLSLRPGENIVSVGVVDQVSSASGFARADVVAQ